MNHRTTKRGSLAARVRWAAVLLLLLVLVAMVAPPAAAARPAEVIVLPGASSAEGIAAGRGATFYAGDLFSGDIFRGDVRRGTAEQFIDAPTGRMAVGMAADLAHQLLFVAGGFGHAYVYDTATGATVAAYQLAEIRLHPRLTAGVVERVITSDWFQTPTTVARFGGRLAVVNAKFDTGFPPTADQYEVVLVNR